MTRFVTRLIALFMAASILAACASMPIQISTSGVTSVPTHTEGILVNTQWILASLNEDVTEPPSASADLPSLEFRADGEAAGSGGCNTFSTQYELQNGEISFGPIASTKKACTTDIMQEEQLFFDALASANRYEVSGDRLRIWYANEQSILVFSRKTS